MKNYDKAIEFINSFTPSEDNDFPEYWKFKNLLPHLKIMTGVGIMYYLNTLVSFLEGNESYLEFGTNGGSTLVGAAYENINVPCYGLDNFEHHVETRNLGDNIEEVLKKSLKKFASHADYFKMDGYEFLKEENNLLLNRVSIYFYDGLHETEETISGVFDGEHLFTDRAIILLDDISFGDRGKIEKAIKVICENDKYKLLKEWHSTDKAGALWYGLAVLSFERK